MEDSVSNRYRCLTDARFERLLQVDAELTRVEKLLQELWQERLVLDCFLRERGGNLGGGTSRAPVSGGSSRALNDSCFLVHGSS